MAAVEDTRHRVEAALREAPDGLDVHELGARLGLHPNTVRWHLGTLADAGLVSSAPQPRRGRGRPRILYRSEPQRGAGTRDEYRLLATVLSGTLASTPGGVEAVERAGREWGRYLAPRRPPLTHVTDEEARQAVVVLLAEQGFCPETCEDEVRMRRCPFLDLAESHPDVVCAVHRGVIDGALEELGSDLRVGELDVLPQPDLCVARLARAS